MSKPREAFCLLFGHNWRENYRLEKTDSVRGMDVKLCETCNKVKADV